MEIERNFSFTRQKLHQQDLYNYLIYFPEIPNHLLVNSAYSYRDITIRSHILQRRAKRFSVHTDALWSISETNARIYFCCSYVWFDFKIRR